MRREAALIALCALVAVGCAKPRPKTEVSATTVPSMSAIPGTASNSDGSMAEAQKTTTVQSSAEEQLSAKPTPAPDKNAFPIDLSLDQWKLISDNDGVQSYRGKQQHGDIVSFRGETLIPSSLAKIATVLNEDELRKQWVDAYVESHVIEQLNKTDRIEYTHSKVPWPFQDRDFVYRANVHVKQNPLQMLITMQSLPDPRAPTKGGIVRGEIVNAFYYMKEVEGVRATRVVVEMAVDPKGAIPLWLMNAVQKRWPYNTLQSLRKICQREDIPTSEAVKNYLYSADTAEGKTIKSTKANKKTKERT